MQSRKRKPNIVLFLTDDQDRSSDKLVQLDEQQPGGTHAAFHTSKVFMPAFDFFWRDSIEFVNCHTSSPVCTPSRYTFLTGQLASRASVRTKKARRGQGNPNFNVMVNPDANNTMALHLQRVGWTTGFIGKFHAGPDLDDVERSLHRAGINIEHAARTRTGLDQNAWIRSLGFDEVHSVFWDNDYEVGL